MLSEFQESQCDYRIVKPENKQWKGRQVPDYGSLVREE